jgi:hypothetical protein
MDFVSDNLIFIVFIVIALVSQIGRLFVRKAERRKRKDGAGAAAYNAYEDDVEDGDAGEGGVFSAWALSVDAEANVPAVAVPVSPAALPFFVQPSAPVPGPSPFPALGADSEATARETGPSVSVRNRARSAAFPEKLDYLPPLKRAVVLAEIFGPPKGFLTGQGQTGP